MKKEITSYVITFVGGLIPELTLAYIIMRITDEGWWMFWLTYLAIQLFYLIVWFFRSIVNTLFFRAFFKRQMVKSIYESLVKRQYPSQGYYMGNTGDVETFFEKISLEPQFQTE
jgi:hypothetical protein